MVLRCGQTEGKTVTIQLQLFFQGETAFQSVSSPRCSEERANWVPNGGIEEGFHIGPDSGKASQQAKASAKKMEPLYFERVHVCISIHLEIKKR